MHVYKQSNLQLGHSSSCVISSVTFRLGSHGEGDEVSAGLGKGLSNGGGGEELGGGSDGGGDCGGGDGGG